MRRAAGLLSVLFAVAASPASGAVIAEEVAAAGPVFDGTGVTWGAEAGRGGIVRTWQDGAVRDRVRLAPARARGARRGFAGYGFTLAASSTWLAFVGMTLRDRRCEGDSCSSVSQDALWSGPAAGPLSPRRAFVTSVAADGPVLAWAETTYRQSRRGRDRHAIVVRTGTSTRRIAAATGGAFVRRVALAGPYVAWHVESRSRAPGLVAVAEHATGRRVLTVRGDVLDAALQADGSVALVRRRSPERADLAWASPASPAPTVIARRAASGSRVAVADGRVVFAPDAGDETGALAVVPLRGGTPRTVHRWKLDDHLLRGFAFDGRRLVWSEEDDPHGTRPGTGRIHLVDAS